MIITGEPVKALCHILLFAVVIGNILMEIMVNAFLVGLSVSSSK